MSDETTLLPCPICGKKVSIARTDNEIGERWWFITRGTYRTTRCNCRLFLESEKFTCGWNDDYSLECRAKLIDKWNTRAELGSGSVDYMLNTIGKLEEENERLRSSCGTLTAEQVRKCVRVGACDHGLWGALDEDTDWQAIADELNAELGSGTCNPVETEVITYYDEYGHDAVKVHVMECDECGGTYEHVNGDYERCPRCGKVTKEAKARYGGNR